MTTMTFQEFAQKVDADGKRIMRTAYDTTLLRAVQCQDGFTVSIQASATHYCSPRDNVPFAQYTAYELGFPSEPDDLITEYADNPTKPKETVYGWVPREVVAQLIEKHGGIKA